jgi:hypothetical protein
MYIIPSEIFAEAFAANIDKIDGKDYIFYVLLEEAAN